MDKIVGSVIVGVVTMLLVLFLTNDTKFASTAGIIVTMLWKP